MATKKGVPTLAERLHSHHKDLADMFELRDVLGKGTFAAVYRATDKYTGAVVAVKRIWLEKTHGTLDQFQAEISTLSLCHHPNISGFHGAFVTEAELWIVMEYVGPSMLDILKVKGKIPEDAMAVICHEVLSGLEYLHLRDQVHLDVKPSNILLSVSGECKLCDLGVSASLSKLMEMRSAPTTPMSESASKRPSEDDILADQQAAQFIGTPLYMPPEIAKKQPHSVKCDVWSLGISAIEMLTGVLPRAELHVVKAIWCTVNEPAPTIGAPFSAKAKSFVDECLLKDPAQRPTTTKLLQHKFTKGCTKKKILAALVAEYAKTTKREVEDDNDDEDFKPKSDCAC